MNERAEAAPIAAPIDTGLRAICGIAGYYRIAADPHQLERELALTGRISSEDDLVRAARLLGLKARVVRGIGWKRLLRVPLPAILRLGDGSFTVLVARGPGGECRIVNPITRLFREVPPKTLFDEMEPLVVLVTRRFRGEGADPTTFGFRWFLPSIWRYRKPLAHVLVASLFVQIFALVTPIFFQVVVDKVLTHKGYSTLVRAGRRPCADRDIRRRAAISAHLRAFAHDEPDRCRTRPAFVRAFAAPSDRAISRPAPPDRRSPACANSKTSARF